MPRRSDRSAPRRPPARTAAVGVLAALALVGCVPTSERSEPAIAPATPGPEPLPTEAVEPLGRTLAIRLVEASGQGPPPESVIERAERRLDLLKGIRIAGVAFLLAVINEGGQSAPVFAGFVHDGTEWQLEDLAALRRVPGVGSNGFQLVVATAGGLVAVGGFVDPSLSRLDVVDPFGTVVDADDPLAGGIVLLSDRFGLVRIHRDEEIVGAEPIRIPTTEAELEQLQPERLEPSTVEGARSVADRFVESLLLSGWVPAAGYYNPQGRPDLLLPQLARVLAPGDWDVTGAPRVTPRGFSYLIDGPEGEARLAIRLNHWKGEWRVAVIEFRTPPGADRAAPIG